MYCIPWRQIIDKYNAISMARNCSQTMKTFFIHSKHFHPLYLIPKTSNPSFFNPRHIPKAEEKLQRGKSQNPSFDGIALATPGREVGN